MKETALNPLQKYFNVFLCVLVILFMAGGGIVFAADTPSGGTGDGGSTANLAWQKQVLTALADAAIKKLDAAENAVQKNLVLSSATKQSALVSLQGVEDQLVLYKTQIAQAATAAEIKALNQQVGQYLQANKNVIIGIFKTALAEIGATAIAKAKQFETALRATLALLKVLCPQQTTLISTVEIQLNTLNADIAALSAAIQARDVATIMQKVNKINTLIQSMNANIKTIQTACQIPL